MAAEAAMELGIPFVAAVPFEGQELYWTNNLQIRYHQLLRGAARVVYTDKTARPQASIAELMQHRNEWMVDHCDQVFAVWDGSKGGTGNCVRYAKLMNKPIYQIKPF